MTNKLEILYPTYTDIKNENEKQNPAVFNHFSYFGQQAVISMKYNSYVVKTMGFIPSFEKIDYKDFDFSKEWFDWFSTKDYNASVFYFQKVVKDMILHLNGIYLSKIYKQHELCDGLIPRQVTSVLKVFE